MICHELKCIFIHQPRTAGTSIEEILVGKDWWSIDPATKHITYEYAKQIYNDYWDDYFKFTVVRNPFSWFVSLYFTHNRSSITREKSNFLWKRIQNNMKKQLPFDKYCLNPIFTRNEFGFTGDQHLNVGKVDLVLKFENLQEDFQKLCFYLGVDKKLLVSSRTLKCNKTEIYRKHYSKLLKQKMLDKYSKDFQLYNYAF